MNYYLAHPWSNNPAQSFQNAVKWTRQLREMQLIVFSPILHTHPYWKELKAEIEYTDVEKENNEYIKKEDWLEWDLAILGSLKNAVVLMSDTAFHFDYNAIGAEHKIVFNSKGCEKEYWYAIANEIPVYVLEDFLQGNMERI